MTFEQIKEAIGEFKIETLSKIRNAKSVEEIRELSAQLEEVDASEVTKCIYPEEVHIPGDLDRGVSYSLSLIMDWALEHVTEDWSDKEYEAWLAAGQPILPEVEDVVHFFVSRNAVRIVNDW